MSRWHTTEFDLLPEHAFRSVGGRMRLEGGGKGGGSSAPPPPDPRLVAQQIKSMGIQDTAITKMMELQDRMAPLQEEQMRFGLDTSRTAYEQSQADREWMLGRRGMLSGVQDKIADEANNFDEAARGSELAALAGADVNQGFSNAAAQQSRGMARMGVNPNSGKFAAASNALQLGQATAMAGAKNSARAGAKAEGRALVDRANNALAGYPAMGMQATGAGAGYGAAGLGLANAGMQGMSAGLSAAGGMAGNMGSNATNMYGQQANYKLGMDKLSASDSDPFGAILGMGAGAAATAFFGPMGGAAAGALLKK